MGLREITLLMVMTAMIWAFLHFGQASGHLPL